MDEINFALLLFRVIIGATIAAHGYGKFFKGGRIEGTAGWFDGMGMRPGMVHAYLAAGTEVTSGVLLMLGFFTTFGALALVALMLVAGYTVHRVNGFFIVGDGWEYNFILAAMAVVIAMLGPGEWSIDNAIGLSDKLDGWVGLALALVGGMAGGIGQLVAFYRPPAKA